MQSYLYFSRKGIYLCVYIYGIWLLVRAFFTRLDRHVFHTRRTTLSLRKPCTYALFMKLVSTWKFNCLIIIFRLTTDDTYIINSKLGFFESTAHVTNIQCSFVKFILVVLESFQVLITRTFEWWNRNACGTQHIYGLHCPATTHTGIGYHFFVTFLTKRMALVLRTHFTVVTERIEC